MSSKPISFNKPAEEADSVSEKMSNAAGQVKDKVSDLGHTAADKIDKNRSAAAGGIEKAASALHEKADSLPGGEKVTSIAHAAADKLNSTAEYVREHDVNKMMDDVEIVVKNNPGRSLLVAGAIGFLVGRAFATND